MIQKNTKSNQTEGGIETKGGLRKKQAGGGMSRSNTTKSLQPLGRKSPEGWGASRGKVGNKLDDSAPIVRELSSPTNTVERPVFFNESSWPMIGKITGTKVGTDDKSSNRLWVAHVHHGIRDSIRVIGGEVSGDRGSNYEGRGSKTNNKTNNKFPEAMKIEGRETSGSAEGGGNKSKRKEGREGDYLPDARE